MSTLAILYCLWYLNYLQWDATGVVERSGAPLGSVRVAEPVEEVGALLLGAVGHLVDNPGSNDAETATGEQLLDANTSFTS
jgi:hypothetical protein